MKFHETSEIIINIENMWNFITVEVEALNLLKPDPLAYPPLG